MSAKVLCFASAKGGAGKTVITATIGTFLSALGKRVLLIDADAATNGLTLLYIKEVQNPGDIPIGAPVLEGLFEGNGLSEPHVRMLPSGVALIPATYHFVNTETYEQDIFVTRLSNTIAKQKREYDYILLDAQAGSDFCASVAMRKGISDFVVLVAEYDPMSSAGVERLKALFRDDLTYARTWILLNKILPEFAKNFGNFLEVARYLSPIPWDADVVRAYARRRLALDVQRGNAFTVAIMQTVRGLLGDEIENDIKLWAQNRAEAIRQPIETQYNDLEREFATIIEQTANVEGYQARKDRQSSTFAAVTFVLGMAFFGVSIVWVSYIVKREITTVETFGLGLLSLIFASVGFGALKTIAQNRMPEAPKTVITLDLAKLHRRREVIEEQLKKLEILRAADPESLLRNRGND